MRLSLIAVAVLACAWFALGVRQAHDLAAATAIATQSAPVTAAQSADAASLLSAAATLNPDTDVKLVRAQLALRGSDSPLAQRLAGEVTRSEPQNLAAWYELASAAGTDHVIFFRALAKVNQLDPPPPNR
jgi:predicted Zn-dependent protease